MLAITITSKDEFDLNDFIYDIYDTISILSISYKFKTDDVDEFHDNNDKFNKEVNELINNLKQKIPEGFAIDDEWDKWEGTIYLKTKKK